MSGLSHHNHAIKRKTLLVQLLIAALSWSPMADVKTIRENQLLGERGIALITEIVLKMGYIFRATPVLDGGIDGEIELRDCHTGAIANQILKVQSKAVTNFANETDDGFDFWPTD